jgi:hypothetical protein
MSEFLALHYESKYDFLLHLCIFDAVTGYKRTPFGRFLNSKKYQILRTYRNKHLNIESKRNKHFIKLIIHKEVLKLQNCEIAFLWLHFWNTRSMKTPYLLPSHLPCATSISSNWLFCTLLRIHWRWHLVTSSRIWSAPFGCVVREIYG